MKIKEKYASSRQRYIEMTDFLSALRSAKGFIYFILLSAMIFTVIFNSLFGIFSIPGAELKGSDNVAVVAEKTARGLKDGDVVLVDGADGFCCAEIRTAENGYYTGKEDDPVKLDENKIIGRVRFVLFPVSCFGDDPHKLCV